MGGGSAVIDQDSFRWRYDNGSESAAGWVDSTNVNPASSNFDYDTNYRLRYLLQNTGTKDLSDGFNFEYQIGALGWNPITTTSNYVRAVTSGNVTDGDSTTQQIGAGTHDEGYIDTGGTIASFTLVQGQESENEIVFQFRSADFTGGETVAIQMVFDNGQGLDSYTNTATLTNMAAPPTPRVPIEAFVYRRLARRADLRR